MDSLEINFRGSLQKRFRGNLDQGSVSKRERKASLKRTLMEVDHGLSNQSAEIVANSEVVAAAGDLIDPSIGKTSLNKREY